MLIEVLKSKIHRVTVTDANLNYIGSITIDRSLMEAANLIENEKVQILNNNNGERFETQYSALSRFKSLLRRCAFRLPRLRAIWSNRLSSVRRNAKIPAL